MGAVAEYARVDPDTFSGLRGHGPAEAYEGIDALDPNAVMDGPSSTTVRRLRKVQGLSRSSTA